MFDGSAEGFAIRQSQRQRERVASDAARKDENEQLALEAACVDFFSRNIGTSTFFENYNYDLLEMAALLANYLRARRR